MIIKLEVPGRIPSKKNSRNIFVRNGRIMNIPSPEYKEWNCISSKHLTQYKIPKVISNIKKIELFFYAPDKRRADLSNKTESIMDLLVDNCIIEDDNWFIISDLHIIFCGVDKNNPRCEILIHTKGNNNGKK